MNDSTLLTELQEAIEAHRVAEGRVAELRHSLITRDVPRPWSFSHERLSGQIRDQPARSKFVTVDSRRSELEEKLEAAVRALSFDTSDSPLYVHASASCQETAESFEVWVHIPQTVPDCVRSDGHSWSVVCLDDRDPQGYPGGRQLTEGCPHCDGQKTTLWPRVGHVLEIISYQAPHHYAEGSVRRRVATS